MDFIKDKGSEFIINLLQAVYKSMYEGFYFCTEKLFGKIQTVLDSGIVRSRNIISDTPEQWNETAFSFIQSVAENAAIPIAGCIITFVFCWQLISMIQESNQMHNIKPETMLILMLKLGLCLLVCAKSFDIVCGLFDLGHWAAEHIPFLNTGSSGTINFNDIIDEEPDEYSFTLVVQMLINMLLTLIAEGIVYVLNVVMLIKVTIWYVEMLVYASAAPIPFATFMNKEWGQVGMNYLRKMLSMSFKGFFMIVAFGLYEALVISVIGSGSTAPDAYLMSIVTTCGCGVGLVLMLSKTDAISASIFNAH